MIQAAAGAILAAAVAFAARRARALARSGALAAFVVGACVFGAGGWTFALTLFAFFIPSSLLSQAGRAQKRSLVDVGKQGARDAWQVLANGAVAALCALLALGLHGPWSAAFAGAFAAASADTWGTEIGTLARRQPRSLLTWKQLPTGISGGVTLVGTLAEVAGALLVGAVAWALHLGAWWAIAAGGLAGALLDSLLGATLQELRYCSHCERNCETDPHVCGAATTRIRGLSWMRNDAVNLLATIAGAAVAYALASAFR